MTAPKPEQGGEEKYRAMWELLREYVERENRIIGGIPAFELVLQRMEMLETLAKRLEAESGGKE